MSKSSISQDMPSEQASCKTTSKRGKYVGHDSLLNLNTGEMIDVEISEYEVRDINFVKIFTQNYLMAIDELSSEKMRVASWLLDHMDRQNRVIATQNEIAIGTGCSSRTVTRALKVLIDNEFVARVHNGLYRVNPEIAFRGKHIDRMNLLAVFKDELAGNAEELSVDEKRAQLVKAIERLSKQLSVLDARHQ